MKRVSDISLNISPDGWEDVLGVLADAERAGYEVEFGKTLRLRPRAMDDRPLRQLEQDAERFAGRLASALRSPATAPAAPEPGNGAVKDQVAPEGTVANGAAS